jgi:hypothetical protein
MPSLFDDMDPRIGYTPSAALASAPQETLTEQEVAYVITMSQKMREALENPTLSEADRKQLIHWYMEALEGNKPLDDVMSETDFRKAVLAEVTRIKARTEANAIVLAELNPPEELESLTDKGLRALPDPEWLVDGLIQKNTITFLAGPPGMGKTFCTIHLTRALASGLNFFGRETKKAKTLYVVAEGASSFKLRIDAWDQKFGLYTPVKDGQIHYLARGVNLSIPEQVDRLRDYFKDGDFDLLVIDTYSQLSGVTDENGAAENATVMNSLRSIREVKDGASVLVVHHPNAVGTKLRGSTTLLGNADTVIMLKSDGAGYFKLSTHGPDGKQKDGAPITISKLKLEPSGPSVVVIQDGAREEPAHWKIMQPILSDGKWHLGWELRQACGILEARGPEYDDWKAYMKSLEDVTLETEGQTRAKKYRLLVFPGRVDDPPVTDAPDSV